MTLASETRDKFDDAQSQIARLRDQVEMLMKDRVTPAVADFADRAETAVKAAGGVMRTRADVVSGQVKDQPLMAVLVAVAVGWVIGRVMR